LSTLFRSEIPLHLTLCEAVGKRAMKSNTDREIVVRDLICAPQDDLESDDEDSDEYSEGEQRLGNKAELESYIAKRRLKCALAKQRFWIFSKATRSSLAPMM
jgi:hypothetical protein